MIYLIYWKNCTLCVVHCTLPGNKMHTTRHRVNRKRSQQTTYVNSLIQDVNSTLVQLRVLSDQQALCGSHKVGRRVTQKAVVNDEHGALTRNAIHDSE